MTSSDSGDSGTGQVEAGPAVQALLGPETLARLRSEAFRQYSCCQCGQPGRTDTGRTVVVAERYRLGAVRVQLAHARCARSAVVDADDPVPEITALGSVLSKTAVLGYATGPPVRPLLLLEPRIELSEQTPGGERMNLWLSALLDQGLTLLRTAGQMPAPADGWLLRLTRNAAVLLAADGAPVFEGPLAPPGPWHELVHSASACLVLMGTIGLYAHQDRELAAADLRRLLSQAARAGDLAGGLVRVRYL